MRELPSGTVTFLFTDIEGSTRLLRELGDAYADALAEHRRALRDAFERHGGVEVDTQGDAFFVAFARAKDGLAAAAQGQQRLAEGPIRVRMGLHTGEPLVTDEGYVGIDVHRAARIAGAGHGGQVLLSQTTRDLVDDSGLRDLGEHRLKDLTAPVRLYQLGENEFPPLKVLFGTNLPVQPNPLVGRELELREASSLLRSHRLLTLLGPGGSGKTRLALQLAADALEDFPDGVFWVPLQAVGDPSQVAATIARAVGAQNGLVEHVGKKRLLLLVDNFEHVLAAVDTVAALVAETKETRLLVTSREPLRISGEQRYPVEPLPENDAVALFIERASAVEPGFEPDASIQGICRRLDGLPLAIELAAARVNVLGNASLAARLEQRLSVLTGGARNAPERQRTLRATIDWSHELLDEAEQKAFRRLAVFAGSFTLESAEAICGATFDTTASLVEKSLVRRWGSGRFGMLETIHEYAREQLAESGEEDDVRRRHAEFLLALAESAHLSAETIEEGPQHELILPEQDNVRAALTWARSNDVILGLRLATALEQFWVTRDPHEGARQLGALLAAAEEAPPELHARGLRALAGSTWIAGDFDRGTELNVQCLELFRALEDDEGVADVLSRLAHDACRRGDYDQARRLSDESLGIHRRLGSRLGEMFALSVLGKVERGEGNDEAAFDLTRQSAALAGEIGFRWWQVGSLYTLSEWSLMDGRLGEGERYAGEALGLAHRIGDRQHIVYLLALLARTAAEHGDLDRAGLLWGTLESEERRGAVGQWEAEREEYAAPVLAHESADFERARQEGRLLPLDEAVEYALSVD